MKEILTASILAELEGVSFSYICRLCRLDPKSPKYIENVKLHEKMYMITDKRYHDKYPGRFYLPKNSK